MTALFQSFSVVGVTGDGNCFYRSVCKGLYDNEEDHGLLRKKAMDALLEKIEEYSVYFDTESRFKRCVAANRRNGVWNSEIGDIVPAMVAKLLDVKMIIHNYDDNELSPTILNAEGSKELHLLHLHCHYSLLTAKER